MVSRTWRKRGIGSDCNGYRVSFCVDENVPKLTVVMVAYLNKCTKNH